MEVVTEKTVKVTLVLNEEETAWLHGVMQNTLHGEHPNEEMPHDAEMRMKFFKATHLQ